MNGGFTLFIRKTSSGYKVAALWSDSLEQLYAIATVLMKSDEYSGCYCCCTNWQKTTMFTIHPEPRVPQPVQMPQAVGMPPQLPYYPPQPQYQQPVAPPYRGVPQDRQPVFDAYAPDQSQVFDYGVPMHRRLPQGR